MTTFLDAHGKTKLIQARQLLTLADGRRATLTTARALALLAAQEEPDGDKPVSVEEAQIRIADFQRATGLNPTGTSDAATRARVAAELEHRHISFSRMRTVQVQEMLEKVGFVPAAEEVNSRRFGDSTRDQITRFQQSEAITVDGLVGHETLGRLREQALAATLSTKTQTAKLQRTLLRAGRARGLNLQIDGAEMKARTMGPSTEAVVRALQEALALPSTGRVDPATFERVTSVAASRQGPLNRVPAPDPQTLSTVPRQLRLNMVTKDVPQLQRTLAFFGNPPAASELQGARFGPSTRKAVLAFQSAHGLPQTGAVDGSTRRALNAAVREATPAPAQPHRIRGTVRNASWAGRGDVTVELRTNPVIGDPVVIAVRRTLVNGFYDMPYDVPKDPVSGQPVSPLRLRVRFLDAGGNVLGEKALQDPTPVAWVNFTEGPYPYQGPSVRQTQLDAVARAGVSDVTTLEETADRPQVSLVAQAAGLTQDDVMRLILAARTAPVFGGRLHADFCFAFLAQSMPTNVPDDLLAQTHGWTLIEQLTDLVASGIAFTDPTLARTTLLTAVEQNLVPVTVAAEIDTLLAELDVVRRRFALDRPLLVGNGTLRQLLERSAVPSAAYETVADVFVLAGGLGPSFWMVLRETPDAFGGGEAVASLEASVDVGLVAKNFEPMVTLLTARIADPAHPEIASSRELATLTVEQWAQIVAEGGGAVPPNTDGATPQEQQLTYAHTMASQSERLFPTVAVVAQVKRSGVAGLSRVDAIADIVNAHKDLELRVNNIDTYIAEKNLDPDPETRTQLRVLQRVARLGPTAQSATALLANGLHSSLQIVSLGRDQVVRQLGDAGVDARTASSIHGQAEHQYAQVLQRLGEWRAELQLATPAVLSPQLLTAELREELLGQFPDLELLFGPLDVCDCPHCESVYGPAAYLADILRFLDRHDAETGGQKVRQVLAQRRPEVGTVKLDCPNTETPLPYIDLVNEVLEAAYPGSAGRRDLQTTRTADELRAAPEHEDGTVYEMLRVADTPLTLSLDLWQEQTRTLLAHLGVPRWKLQHIFRPAGAPAGDADEAAEYFGISSHESDLIQGSRTTDAEQSPLWGFDATRAEIPVLEMLGRAGISYLDLQLLLTCGFVTPSGANQVALQRPPDRADLTLQRIINLSPEVLDRIHRLLRLSRHVPWDFWELDLVLKAARIGNGMLDGPALVALQATALVGERLRLNAEQLATWFGSIPVESHPDADDPTNLRSAAPSLYATTFLSRSVSDPPDPGFDPLPDGSDLQTHRPTLLAALSVSETALDALLERTGTGNDLATLSRLIGWRQLATSLRCDLAELLVVADLLSPLVADPFSTPTTMLAFVDLVDEVRGSGLSIAEQDFLLFDRPDSPLAPSEVLVRRSLDTVREGMRTNPAATTRGQVVSSLASATGLTPAQLDLLLNQSDAAGPLAAPFDDPQFIAQDTAGQYLHEITETTFARLFEVYRRLLKMARVAVALGLDADSLAWFLQHQDVLDFRLADLPVTAPPPAPLAGGWLSLLRWRRAHDGFSGRATAVAARPGQAQTAPTVTGEDLVHAAAPGADVATVRGIAASLTGIDVDTLRFLDGDGITPYTDPVFLLRLLDVAGQLQRLGVAPKIATRWSRREQVDGSTEREVASQVRSAVKAKYDRTAWLAVLGPLQDTWREHKRDALVASLIEHSVRTEAASVQIDGKDYANPKRWTAPDDLTGYFLLDVQMSSCQMTSRIKHLIGAVQMFVQRVFLNLEQPHVLVTTEEKIDPSSPDSWRQWKWMKSYRTWEANRKVFLYPENWIEPELRDDKTPFFLELEQEILQGDVTSERCEAALRSYLEKLEEVSNIDIVGVHHEIDDDHPWDNLPPSVNTLHVIGRTKGEPFRHYYRRYDLITSLWSPWEEIEVDITGDQVLPVVYNRVLHLFWLQIAEKAQKTNRQPAAKPTSTTQPAPESPTQMELKLAWTVRRKDGWLPRQVSPQVLIHPWKRPVDSYTLKPRYHNAENQLWLDVYISRSPEFNSTRFWDPYSGRHVYLTSHNTYIETARPWHSSSFVFEGTVAELRLKPLPGEYHVLDASGTPTAQIKRSDSYQYVRSLSGPAGRNLKTLAGPGQISARIVTPTGMHLEAGRLRNNTWNPNNGSLNVLEGGGTATLLQAAKPPFGLVHSLHRIQLDTAAEGSPFFYSDTSRSYFVTSQWATVNVDSTTTMQRLSYTFLPFHHPYAALLLRELNRSGVDGLLNRTLQRFPNTYPPGNSFVFSSYAPVEGIAASDPTAERDTLDFSRSGAMSVYNWEVFFHIPFLIACRLTTNQRFEEALEWFHRIFDPTNTESVSAPQRFWVTKPFFDQNDESYRRQRIETLLADANLDATETEIREWRNNPFKPDVIARFRPIAYQKAVVMKYLDALIAWGDQLFRRDTIESINEATTLYILAMELLGRRPERVPAVPRDAKSYDQLVAEQALDPFGNAQVDVQLENMAQRPALVVASDEPGGLPVVQLPYFGIPANTELLAYWDTVADRHFKIRHCMNISGVVRQLPLFEPPIDPALLVRAAAAGVDLDSVLNPTPGGGSGYRFATLFTRAMSYATDVRVLGDRMLAALERRDVEALERLRATNDTGLQPLITHVREAQVTEAERLREALEQSKEAVQARIDHYSAIPYMNAWEVLATASHGAGLVSQIVATVLNNVAGGARLAPTATFGGAGFGGSPVATVSYGGENISDSTARFAELFNGLASILHSGGSMLETQGGYQRQHENNQFQAESARKELAQLEKQIIAAMAREAVARAEETAQNRAVENAQGVDEYLRSKYTATELFDWMVGQLSTLYFQAYQLAYDIARRAEQAYRFELGDNASPPMIKFGYWDSLKKGLLAGDRLVNDLRRLEATYLDRHTRRLRATTHVSLATLMPEKLLELKIRGTTSIELAEWLFARENPGWINQRIVSVAVTAPCTSGPWVGVHGGLTLTQAVVRANDSMVGGFGDAFDENDDRFQAAMCPVTAIRFSHGGGDRGSSPGSVADDRYEAFEGAGLISRWTVTLDPRDNAFDLSTLTDFVISIEYEGDVGPVALVDLARDAVQAALPTNGARLMSLDGSYRAQWFRFLRPQEGEEQRLQITIATDDLPFLYRRLTRTTALSAVRADLVLQSEYAGQFDIRVEVPGAPGDVTPAPRDAAFGGMHHGSISWPATTRPLLGDWEIQVKREVEGSWDALPEDLIEHSWILFQFEAQ